PPVSPPTPPPRPPPPPPISPSRPAASLAAARNTAVDGSSSGLPDNPPASVACADNSPAGRAIVVLDTINPCPPAATQVSPTEASPSSDKSGEIFTSSGGRR